MKTICSVVYSRKIRLNGMSSVSLRSRRLMIYSAGRPVRHCGPLGKMKLPYCGSEARRAAVHGPLYQQSPHAIEGSLFKTDCIEILDSPPVCSPAQVVRAWDLAATVDA